MNEQDDVLGLVRAGDPAALARFIDMKRPQLLAFVTTRLGKALAGRVEAEDVVQDTAIAALRGLSPTEPGDRDPFGWLCQLAEQRIIDRAREAEAQKRDVHREVSGHERVPGADGSSAELIDLLAASLTSVTKAVVRNERHARLQKCLQALPESVQEVLRLRFVEGATTRDIGERLGKTDGAVRVLISRTLRDLQSALAGAEPNSM